MAFPSWLSVTPTTGTSGTITVTLKAVEEHTGRLTRSYTISGCTNTSNKVSGTCAVTQAAKAEHVTTAATAVTCSSGANQSVTITGYSNSSALTFSFSSNNIGAKIPANYTVKPNKGSGTAITVTGPNSATAIEGDPGESADYQWSITITGNTVNNTISQRTAVLSIKGAGITAKSVTIKQSAGSPTFNITGTASLAATQDSTATISVTSNDSWTLS